MTFSKLPVLALVGMALVCAGSSAQEAAQFIPAPVVIGTDVDCFRIAPDLNGDGDKDAVGIWFAGPGSMRVAGWRNDGSGVFTPGWSITVPLTFNPPLGVTTQIEAHVAVGDLNGDGAEDFAFSLDNQVGWWISNGDSDVPSIPWVVVLPGPVRDLVVADFDLDGRADVATLRWEDVRIYRTQAAAPPVLASTLMLANGVPGEHLVAAELSGDATPDLAVLRVGSFSINPVLGGVFQPSTPFLLPYLSIISGIAAGDVDADGDVDLVVSAAVQGIQTTGVQMKIHVVRRTGPATFILEPAQTLPPPPGTLGTMLADVDADGDLDLIAPGGFAGVSLTVPLANLGGGGASVWRNIGGGAFGSHEGWLFAGTRGALAIADLDGDGDADAIGGRCVAYGIPGRGVLPEPVTANPRALKPPEDWDRDGDPDLGPGISAGAQNFLAINDGNGTFVSTPVIPPAAAPGTSYSGPGFRGDFDGDGDLDLMIEHLNGTSIFAGFEMRLLANVGGGGLVDGGPASPNGTTMRIVTTDGPTGSAYQLILDDRAVLVADVDGDADLDVIALYPTLDGGGPDVGSKIWLNGGTGFFTPGAGMPGIRPTGAGDLTGDGILDLVAMQKTTASTSALVVLAGLGGGSFAAPSVLASGLTGQAVVDEPMLVDLDQDGDRDLVAAVSGNLTAFTNDGFANFTSNTIGAVDATNDIHAIRTGDLNGDGLIDVIANVSTGVRVFLRDPAGPGWLAPRNWSAGLGALSDVDGDGDLDLLFGFLPFSSGLYRNLTISPPASGLRKQYGSGLAGGGGFAPVLGSAGILRAGFSGEVRITNALGGAAGYFGVGSSAASQPVLGGTLLITPDLLLPITLGGAPGVPGAGYTAIPWTLPASLAGVQLFEQAALIDPSAPQGASLTQGIRCVIGS